MFGEHILEHIFSQIESHSTVSNFTIKALEACNIGFIDGVQSKYSFGTLPPSQCALKIKDNRTLVDLHENGLAEPEWKSQKKQVLKDWIKEWKNDPTMVEYKRYKSKHTKQERNFKF